MVSAWPPARNFCIVFGKGEGGKEGRGESPASRSKTLGFVRWAVNLAATIDPEVPAPTTMKSYSTLKVSRVMYLIVGKGNKVNWTYTPRRIARNVVVRRQYVEHMTNVAV